MNLTLLFTLAFLLATGTAGAAPREHANCPVIQKITDPKNSAGYRMSQDCLTAYVLPPNLGQIRVSPIQSPDSVMTCGGILASVNALSAQNQILSASVKEKASLIALIAADRLACMGVHGQQTAVQNQIAKLKGDLATAQADLDSKKQFQVQCRSTPDARGCDSIDDKIGSQEDRISTLNDRLSEATQKSDDVQDRVANCEGRHPHSQEDNTNDINQMDGLNTKIADLSKRVTAERKRLIAIPGGDASLTFTSNHADMVHAYKTQNEGLGVSFVQMPLKKATIHFELVKNGNDANMASVARFKIFGATPAAPAVDAPAGDGVDVGAQDAERLFGGAVGAQISLNLYAACNLRQAYPDLSSPRARQAVANLIRPTVTYNYELQATKDIKINYNETYLYQLIKEHSTHGGLFWSSSSESITENTVSNKWLTIIESSEDTDLTWEAPEKVLFDLRREVLDAALGRVAMKTYASPSEAIADGGTPPEDGAKVASKNLRQFPNVYCQVAAIALDIGDALFGGSSSTGTTTRTVSKSDIQNLVINGMVKFAGTQSFEAAGE